MKIGHPKRKFIFQLSTIHFQVQSVDFTEDISGFWFLYPHRFANNQTKTTKFWQPTRCTLAVKSTKFITPKPFFQGPKNPWRPCLKVCWIVNQDVQVTWFLQIQTRHTHTHTPQNDHMRIVNCRMLQFITVYIKINCSEVSKTCQPVAKRNEKLQLPNLSPVGFTWSQCLECQVKLEPNAKHHQPTYGNVWRLVAFGR